MTYGYLYVTVSNIQFTYFIGIFKDQMILDC